MASIPARSFFFLDPVFSLPCCVLLLLLVDKDPLRRPEPEPPGPVENINFFPDDVDSFFSLVRRPSITCIDYSPVIYLFLALNIRQISLIIDRSILG
jgi:hypothetical protein